MQSLPPVTTTVNLVVARPQKNRHAIFVSAGDRETFATYSLRNLTDAFDIIVFQYGTSQERRAVFERDATVFATGSATKFNALRALSLDHRELLERYETLFICDDDLVLEFGDYRLLPEMALALGVEVLSPAHSIKGKISHQIMLPVLGRHFFRFTSFVEMTCPLFTVPALLKFLHHYDGSMRGYAEEWWFLSVLGADKRAIAGIADSVTIVNPHNFQKSGGYGEAELQAERDRLRLYWLAAMEKYGMKEWPAQTLSYVRHDSQKIRGAKNAARFRRPASHILRTALAALNYNMRFYGLRKRLAERFR